MNLFREREREREVIVLYVEVSNGWVSGGHNWIGYIKFIYPLKPI